MPISSRDDKFTYLSTVMVFVLLWSSAFAMGKMALAVSPPQLFLGLRFGLAGLLMLGFALATRSYRPIGWRGWAKLVVLGVLNQAGYQGLAWVAMGTISSGLTAVIISMNPIFIAMLAVLMLGEKMSVRRGIGLALGILGVVIVLNSRITVSGEDVGGILIMAVSLSSVVLGAVMFKKWTIDAPLSVTVGGQFLAAGVLLLATGLATEDVGQIQFGADYVWIMAYIVFGVTIGGVGLWFYLLTHGSASDASALHFLMPPFGLMFGWWLLGEDLVVGDLIGIVPIAIGIWMATHKRKNVVALKEAPAEA